MRRRDVLQYAALALVAMPLEGMSPFAGAASDTPNANLPRRKEMSNINERVASYLAVWNERDPVRRRELVAKTWAENGRYIDAHRNADGHASIDGMIETAQRQFPGYQLRLVSGIEAHNGYVRFRWAAGGTEGAPLYLGGTDFASTASDGRFQSVVGFVDAAPAR